MLKTQPRLRDTFSADIVSHPHLQEWNSMEKERTVVAKDTSEIIKSITERRLAGCGNIGLYAVCMLVMYTCYEVTT